MLIYFLLLVNVVLLVAGQILWKIGLSNNEGIRFENITGIIFSPYILAGLFLYIIATGIWFVILSKADLSLVYPLQSLAYVLGMAAGLIIFKEYIPVTRWIGVGIIFIGVYFVTLK